MDFGQALLAFTGVALLLTVTPGLVLDGIHPFLRSRYDRMEA
ncbi:hypothetical protein ACL90Y_11205 [Micrococcus luteus]